MLPSNRYFASFRPQTDFEPLNFSDITFTKFGRVDSKGPPFGISEEDEKFINPEIMAEAVTVVIDFTQHIVWIFLRLRYEG